MWANDHGFLCGTALAEHVFANCLEAGRVVIVGAGPVGAAVALLLARAGVAVCLVERALSALDAEGAVRVFARGP
ncbi:MAG: FAD-dependent monooxygenase [Egibacteraceae bacterium]